MLGLKISSVLTRARGLLRAASGLPPETGSINPPALRIEADRQYDMRYPTWVNSIDIFHGQWSGSLPSLEMPAGSGANLAFYNDIRLHDFDAKIGGFSGKSVIELGPLEAGHSYLLEKFGAAENLAIEANTAAFLKCLIVKEILGLKSLFLLGDFNKYLSDNNRRFDVVLACGVLYHQIDPLGLIEGMTKAADCICVWTQYYASTVQSNPGLSGKFSARPIMREFHGQTIELYEYYYAGARRRAGFTGGAQVSSFWMTQPGIIAAFDALGFVVEIMNVQTDHPNGPAMNFLARRRSMPQGGVAA
jgi:hypothetical protein